MARERLLSRNEAILVSNWLKEEKGKSLEHGYLDVWKLTPTRVSEQFDVEVHDVEVAARRITEEVNE